ncbi:MAG: thymidine kinase [Paracoccaceae bacterium]|jgi:thymidine kinase|nr:thymidine kinase [Paracoccaceae bacterium]
MAKLYFNYSTMNAGKSTVLLQASHNYIERGMRTMLLTARLDDRKGVGKIGSRIGLEAEADTFSPDQNLYNLVEVRNARGRLACVLVDEAQFLEEEQVWQLARVADDLKIPVMCYGLRTDFQGQLFPGSAALLALADNLREVRTICWCGSKATMVVRLGVDGGVQEEGDQIAIGDDIYVSLCRKHWRERRLTAESV